MWNLCKGFNLLLLRSILGMFYDACLRYARGFERL